MATYPSDPAPIYPVNIAPEYRTIVSGDDDGGEQRRKKWAFPKYSTSLKYSQALSATELQTLWDFYHARCGMYEAFYCYDWDSKDHAGQYCGQGDGSTTIFDIPVKSRTGTPTIYVAGVVDAGVTILTGGGASDSDRVQLSTAPADGALITADFTGLLRFRCRFKDDSMSFERFSAVLFSTGVALKGLKPA
jgi:hypothetical protein